MEEADIGLLIPLPIASRRTTLPQMRGLKSITLLLALGLMKTRRGEVAASGGPAPKKKRAPPKKFSASEDAAIALVGAKGLTMAWLDEALGSSRERSSNRWRRAIKSKIEDKTVNHIKSKSTTELPLEEIALEVVRDMHHQMPQAAFNREIAAARAVVAPLVERFEKEEAAKAAAAANQTSWWWRPFKAVLG